MNNEDESHKKYIKKMTQTLTNIWNDLGNSFKINQNNENVNGNMNISNFDPFGPENRDKNGLGLKAEEAVNDIIEEYRSKILEVEKENRDLKQQLSVKKLENDKIREMVKESENMKDEHNFKIFQELRDENEKLIKINVMLQDTVKTNSLNNEDKNIDVISNKEYKDIQIKMNNLKMKHQHEIEQMKIIMNEKEKELNLKKENDKDLYISMNELKTENQLLIEEIKKIQKENEHLNHISKQIIEKVKMLQNEILDLKGNIRVFCRIKPSMYQRIDDFSKLNFMVSENTISFDKHKFNFDKVFYPTDNQEKIFSEISFLSDSVVDGFNGCIFAYGQTGSGKTYTMEGTIEQRGIIPNVLTSIFDRMEGMKEVGWSCKIIMNYIEIYNETINDLFNKETDVKFSYEIKSEKDMMHITNCKYLEIESKEHAFCMLQEASKNRSVASTKCNDRSSRSHSIFTCNLEMKNNDTGEIRKSTLNLIDLAGSERLSESGSEGQRLKETKYINKSLSDLGNVINALLKKDRHVPFRNSKLTYYLQSCLNSTTRVLMIVNVSQELNHVNETICSLRFAQKVSECKLGMANKNVFINI